MAAVNWMYNLIVVGDHNISVSSIVSLECYILLPDETLLFLLVFTRMLRDDNTLILLTIGSSL